MVFGLFCYLLRQRYGLIKSYIKPAQQWLSYKCPTSGLFAAKNMGLKKICPFSGFASALVGEGWIMVVLDPFWDEENLKMMDVLIQIILLFQMKFFLEPVPEHVHRSEGDVVDLCYVFGRKVQLQKSAIA
jgi:hypothetical protein